MQKFTLTSRNGKKTFCGKKCQCIPGGLKQNFQITLSCTIFEINAFLHFTQKFKMAAKDGGKTIFGKPDR